MLGHVTLQFQEGNLKFQDRFQIFKAISNFRYSDFKISIMRFQIFNKAILNCQYKIFNIIAISSSRMRFKIFGIEDSVIEFTR